MAAGTLSAITAALTPSDLDTYRTAKLLIDQHGLQGASEHAANRIAALRDKEDDEEASVWGMESYEG